MIRLEIPGMASRLSSNCRRRLRAWAVLALIAFAFAQRQCPTEAKLERAHYPEAGRRDHHHSLISKARERGLDRWIGAVEHRY